MQAKHMKEEIDVLCVVILNSLKVSCVLQESTNAEIVRDMVILQTFATEGQSLPNPEHPRHISCKLDCDICEKILCAASQVI